MFSLTPFFANPYVAVMASPELQPDRDLAHMVNNLTHHFIPDRQGIYHCEPSYLYEADEKEARIEVDLPGVLKENLSVQITPHNKLVVNAKRFRQGDIVEQPQTSETKENDVVTGKEPDDKPDLPKPFVLYELKLRIAHKYDPDKLQASMDRHGVLKVVIPIKSDHVESERLIRVQ